ncbi:NADPH-dependent F420 reductase [Polymorphospora rubra]|uniref:NADP oxidoreductase n=1 Tax=Polymorphospora rubra TaxID=338584 RepID=A0A810N553_9ACTN|nr:NADPH-dependent F420 reductase [Polymorphospora rubra]BCJ68871.1 NADP oxidoreductase [Polymorphospora rubra]
MQISVIGTGHIGGTLARHFASAEHHVAVAHSGDPADLGPLLDDLRGCGQAVSPAEAARIGEVVVVSVPFRAYADLPTDGLAGKTVIDTTNYMPDRDGHIPELDEDRTTSSEMVQAHLRDAHVVKAFNTMRWDHLRDYHHEAGAQVRYGIPLAGDDIQAKRCVQQLIEEIGFAPVDSGGLATGGRRQQPGSPAFLSDQTADQLQATLSAP